MSRIFRPQAGDSKLGCLIWLIIVAFGIMVAVKMVPIKVQSIELYEYMDEQAKFATRASPEALKKRILDKARELEIPLDPKDLSVTKPGGRVQMSCKYTVPVDLLIMTYNWEFEHSIDKPVFQI